MVRSALAKSSTTSPEIVDISRVDAGELEVLWERERQLWLERLYWDVAPMAGAVRQAMERGKLRGNAARLRDKALGCAYYMVERQRAVVGGVLLAPDADARRIGPRILGALLGRLQSDSAVVRIESQFISFDPSWLTDVFVCRGFDVYPRAFLRRSLDELPRETPVTSSMAFELWDSWHVHEASVMMQQAHAGRVDAQMNELYRTRDGCRTLLDSILYQKGCGTPIRAASFLARDRARALSGLVIATEISPGHAHLAQVAVSPSMQGQGLGRQFLSRTFRALARQGYQTVSLMVSGSNRRAFALYRSTGFDSVIRFPVFVWDRRAR